MCRKGLKIIFILQSDRVDFIKLMLEANEAKGKISDTDLEMKADHDEEDVKENGKEEEPKDTHVRINKEMTMEVSLIFF